MVVGAAGGVTKAASGSGGALDAGAAGGGTVGGGGGGGGGRCRRSVAARAVAPGNIGSCAKCETHVQLLIMVPLCARLARGAAGSRCLMHGADTAHLQPAHPRAWAEEHRHDRLMNLREM